MLNRGFIKILSQGEFWERDREQDQDQDRDQDQEQEQEQDQEREHAKRSKIDQPVQSGGKPHAVHTLARARYVMSWRRYALPIAARRRGRNAGLRFALKGRSRKSVRHLR